MKETLEDASEKYAKMTWGVYYDDVHPDIAITQTQGEITVKDFKEGAQWQAERMYSEEQVLKLVDGAFHMYASSKRHDAKEWLVEQFKKK